MRLVLRSEFCEGSIEFQDRESMRVTPLGLFLRVIVIKNLNLEKTASSVLSIDLCVGVYLQYCKARKIK